MITARDTYSQLLEESDMDPEEVEELIQSLETKIAKEDFREELVNILNFDYTLLHPYFHEGDEFIPYGVVVVMISEGKSLVLDGNHRVNTLKHRGDTTEFPVIIISGVLPER